MSERPRVPAALRAVARRVVPRWGRRWTGSVRTRPRTSSSSASSEGGPATGSTTADERPRFPLGGRTAARIAATEPTGDLALVAMVLDEGPFLAEWLAFQRLVGFQRVHLYDNGSTDETRDVVAPFVRDGLVEVIEWPITNPPSGSGVSPTLAQQLAYLHALERVGHRWRWMAFLDADEFLFPAERPDLVTFLRDYEDLPALVAFWRMFGTSGLTRNPAAPIIEHLTMMAPFPTHAKAKALVQPRHVRGITSTHVFDTTAGIKTAFDEHRRRVRYSSRRFAAVTPEAPDGATADLLLLNHYFARSVEDLAAKRDRLAAGGRDNRARTRAAILELIERDPHEDLAIQRFVPALKDALATLEVDASPSDAGAPGDPA